MRWGSSTETMLQRGRSWLTVTCAILFFVWAALLVMDRGSIGGTAANSIFAALLFVLSVLTALALDFICMSSAISGIGHEIISGRWDLLRLTLLRTDQIIAAKHGAAQTRAWRLMTLLIGARLAITAMVVVSFVVIFLRDRSYGVYQYSPTLVYQDLLGYGFVILFCLVYSVEPFWRMRAVTALGVAISTRTQQHAVGVMAALAAIMAIWLAQGFIILTIFMFASFLLAPLIEFSTLQTTICSSWLLLGMFAGVVYGFYSIIQTWSLRSAERWLAQIK